MNQASTFDNADIAQAILHARKNHLPVDAIPFADRLKTTADAYAIQNQVYRSLEGQDVSLAQAWKSGGPNRASEQTHAALLAQGIVQSGVDLSNWPLNIRIVEIEIAFRLNREVTAQTAQSLTYESSRQFIDAMTVAIEVVDSRWEQTTSAQALLKLADMQSHAALVLGQWVPFEQKDMLRDWSKQNCTLTIGSASSESFVGTHTLQDPTYVLRDWLRYATAQGQTIASGTIITTGSWCGMPFAKKGDLIVAEFAGIGKTSVQL